MKKYAARVCPDGRVQTVTEHTDGVCRNAWEDARLLGAMSAVELICRLHDMGKNTALSNAYQHTVGVGNEWSGERPIHAHAGAKLVYEQFFLRQGSSSFAAALLSELTETAVMSHHGLFDCFGVAAGVGASNGILRKIRNDHYDYEEAKSLLFAQILSEPELNALFVRASGEILVFFDRIKRMAAQKNEVFFYLSMLYRMLLSVLVNADHADAAAFSSQEPVVSVYGDEALWARCADFLESRLAAFILTTPLQIVRNEISERVRERACDRQSVVRLRVPTGGGKTLSSLRYALHHAKRFRKSRIIYVAPFNSILEQNAAEFRRFLPETTELLEHFGDLLDGGESGSVYRYYAENWGSPVIATSMVQFLDTLFLGKMSSVRRMRGLINAVVIFDEIQSVPVECVTLFNLAVNFLSELCHCTVVLCSATQPAFERDMTHKLRLSADCELLAPDPEAERHFRRTRIADSLKAEGYSFAQTAAFVMRLAEETKSVLLIVNTKAAAREIYSLIKDRLSESAALEDCSLVHLSTHMCPAHRKAALAALRAELGGGKRVICVSTQLIEAGVDISFETVVRSLAGLDSIIQSAGRCNRNKETELGTVHVINIAEEDISRIKTIKIGASITRRLMETMRKNPALFGGDITSEAAVSLYYRDYFAASREELDDKTEVDGVSTTVYQLLSENADLKRRAAVSGETGVNHFFNQAFKTAGEAFQVIEDHSNTVVVPYGEGKELIEMLCAANPPKQPAALLRRLQPYSIGLSKEQCAYRTDDKKTGILMLKEGFYNSEYGFDPEGSAALLWI